MTTSLARYLRAALAGSLFLGGALTATDSVAVVPASAATVITTIPVGNSPTAISSDGTHVWTANFGDNTVTEINASTGSVVQTIPVGNAPCCLSSDGTNVWVSNFNDGTVTEINASTGSVVQTIPVGSHPGSVSSDGTQVWVVLGNGSNAPFGQTLVELDASTGAIVQNIFNPGFGDGGVSSDGIHVWLSNFNSGTVTEFDASTGAFIQSISVGIFCHNAWSDGTHVWVSLPFQGYITELDASTGAFVQNIPITFGNQNGVMSDGTHVWVSSYASPAGVIELNASDGSVVQTIPLGSPASASYGVTSDGTNVWSLLTSDNTVAEISTVIAPDAPTLARVTAADGSISVSFIPSAASLVAPAAHRSPVVHPASATAGYTATCKSTNAGIDGTASGVTSPIVVSGLTNGKSYQCSLYAFNAGGNSPPSALSAVVIPSASPGTVECTNLTLCHASTPAAGSSAAPGQDTNVAGTPDSRKGSITLTQTTGTLGCPSITNKPVPIYDLTDTGFSPATRLHITLTLHFAAATATEQVCFNSTVPFRSQEHPTAKSAGTGLLLACNQVANLAPCVVSSKTVGSNIVVQFVVPGGDPRFSIVLPTGRAVWASTLSNPKVGKPYSADMQSAGGKAPIRWDVKSGKLPHGLALNPSTGVIAGTPNTKGTTTALVEAKDSEPEPKTASVNLPFTVK